ncbi:hypothetical protein [Dietzia sp.]|uniref:hypothetical protein n=1 Tax=Dietzia sp. TaxID=1871616 RepID=UPI002FDAB425
MRSAPGSNRGVRRIRTGAAVLALTALSAPVFAACSPDDAASADDQSSEMPAPPPEKEDHSTTVKPSPLDDAEVSPGARPQPIVACDAVGLTVDQVAEIVGVQLMDSEPAAPAASPEMCAYGSHWDEPDVLLESMKGAVQGSEEESDASGTSAAPTKTGSPSDDSAEEPSQQLDSENAVFVAVRPLRKGEDGAATLESIPTLAGPLYTCNTASSTVDVPDPSANAAAKRESEGPAPLDGVSSLGTLPAVGLPTQIGRPTPSKGSPASSTSAASTGTAKPGAAGTTTSAAAQKRAAKQEVDALRCDSTPTGSSPHTQTFFVARNALWQVSVNTPGRSDDDKSLDDESKGLLSLAAYISTKR